MTLNTQSATDTDGGVTTTGILAILRRGYFVFFMFLTSFARDKKSRVLLVLGLLPVFVVVATDMIPQGQLPGELLYSTLFRTLYILLIIPLFGLLLGTAALADEIESHTMIQIIVRPIRRAEVLFWRYVATVTAGTLVGGICATALFVPIALISGTGLEILGGAWGLCLVCNLVYCAIFVMLGITIKKPLLWGILVTLYEQLLGTLFVIIGGGAISLSGHVQNVGQDLMGYYYLIPDWPPVHSAILLAALIINCLLLALVIFQAKDLS